MSEKKPSPFALRVEERAPLSVIVSRQLRQAIMSGRVSVGTELPSEKELTAELGVGRSTIRRGAPHPAGARARVRWRYGLDAAPAGLDAADVDLAAAQAMENAVRLGQVPLGDLVELRVVVEGRPSRPQHLRMRREAARAATRRRSRP